MSLSTPCSSFNQFLRRIKNPNQNLPTSQRESRDGHSEVKHPADDALLPPFPHAIYSSQKLPSFPFSKSFNFFYFLGEEMEEEDCGACEEWEEHYYWEHADDKGKLFFRVMLDDFSHSMRIPKKFANHLKGELSETVCLKDPSGIIWHVGLMKTVDGAFLHSGWKDFVEAHCLKENDLLIFEYDEDSCFKIKILEGSGCEKAPSYCLKIKDSLKQARNGAVSVTPQRKVTASSSSGSSHDDILHVQPVSSSYEISRNRRATRSATKNQRTRSRYSERDQQLKTKKLKNNKFSGHMKNSWANTSKSVDAIKDARYHTGQEFPGLDDSEKLSDRDICMSRKTSLTNEQETRAAQLAHAVCYGNPYFISVMQPSSIGKRFFLTVPSRFKAYLPSQNCCITLQVPGRRKKWNAVFLTNKNMSGLSAYWKCFVHDNSLIEGDICLFELINNHKDNIEMRVRISRTSARTVFF